MINKGMIMVITDNQVNNFQMVTKILVNLQGIIDPLLGLGQHKADINFYILNLQIMNMNVTELGEIVLLLTEIDKDVLICIIEKIEIDLNQEIDSQIFIK